MARIDVVCACVLFLGSTGQARAEEGDGPAPINTTQSVSAGAYDEAFMGEGEKRVSGYGHPSGIYTGVIPGASKGGAQASPHSRGGPPTITWPGFQMLPDGSSRVFIQSTAPIEPKVVPAADGKFSIDLPGARVAARTNRLPLDTRFFNTPVTKVSLNVLRSGATLQLDLRAPVTPHVSSERGAAGYYFTYIELPKGEYVAKAAAPVVDAPTRPGSKLIGKPSTKVTGSGQASVEATQDTRAADGEASARGKASVSAGIKLGL